MEGLLRKKQIQKNDGVEELKVPATKNHEESSEGMVDNYND